MSAGRQKSWQARLSRPADELTERFVESLSVDWRLARYDIAGSIAHAEMLRRVGLIGAGELRRIRAGLKSIEADIEAGRLRPDRSQEDVHMAIEAELIRRVGEPGKKLHAGRSRNDQVSLDMRLWMREAIEREVQPRLAAVQRALVGLAGRQGELLMPGYTHLQRAQPVVLGVYLLAFVEQLQRDRQRFGQVRRELDVCPLGAGALAGTTLGIDRRAVARSLGFGSVAANSMDAASDRDFCVDYVAACAMTMVHLSRLAEDWIVFASQEFEFVRIDDALCTGSSMMPQKRNPDLLELVRAKAGRAVGALVGLLTVLKAQPSGYNRDLQEDKVHVFGAHDTMVASLEVIEAVVRGSRFDAERLARAAEAGFCDATSLAEYLLGRGVSFRQAHQIVGRLVRECERAGRELREVPLRRLQAVCGRIGPDVYDHLGAENVVRRYRSSGSAGRRSLREQLRRWRRRLG